MFVLRTGCWRDRRGRSYKDPKKSLSLYALLLLYYIYMCAIILFAQSLLKKKGSVRKEMMNLSFYHRQYSKTWIKTTFPSYRLTHIQSELADPSLNRPACGRGSLFLILFCDITSTAIRLWKTTRLIYRTEFLCIINRLSNLSDSLFVVLLPTVLLLRLSFSFFFPAIKNRVNHLSSFQVFIVDRISCSSLLIVLLIFNQLHISVFLPSCIRNAIFFPWSVSSLDSCCRSLERESSLVYLPSFPLR